MIDQEKVARTIAGIFKSALSLGEQQTANTVDTFLMNLVVFAMFVSKGDRKSAGEMIDALKKGLDHHLAQFDKVQRVDAEAAELIKHFMNTIGK